MPLMVSVSGVRGIVGSEVNPAVIGRWAASFGEILPPGPVVLGRDSRITGQALSAAAESFLRSIGREVFDVGIVPTPTVQLAVEKWEGAGGLVLSASHNPGQWNALKFVDSDGSFLSPERFKMLLDRHESLDTSYCDAYGYGGATERHADAISMHLESVLAQVDVQKIRAAGLRVALECGHGAAGTLLPQLASRLGVELEAFHVEPTGQLLEKPEPTTESLKEVLSRVTGRVDFLAMIDPDADRCGMAIPGTDYLGEEWTLPLVVSHRLRAVKGPVVTNLSTSSRIEAAAARHGQQVFRSAVGEAHVVGEMKRRDAVIGGEGNGGVIDPRIHLGRDSAVAFALLCEAQAADPGGLSALAREFPPRIMRKDKVSISASGFEPLIGPLEAELGPADDRRDGLRWTTGDGFIHIRASNTEPIVRAVVESENLAGCEQSLGRIRAVLGA